jgi:hypothetical protein
MWVASVVSCALQARVVTWTCDVPLQLQTQPRVVRESFLMREDLVEFLIDVERRLTHLAGAPKTSSLRTLATLAYDLSQLCRGFFPLPGVASSAVVQRSTAVVTRLLDTIGELCSDRMQLLSLHDAGGSSGAAVPSPTMAAPLDPQTPALAIAQLTYALVSSQIVVRARACAVVSLWLFVCVCACWCLCIAVCLRVCVLVSLCLRMSPCVSVSVSLYLCLLHARLSRLRALRRGLHTTWSYVANDCRTSACWSALRTLSCVTARCSARATCPPSRSRSPRRTS